MYPGPPPASPRRDLRLLFALSFPAAFAACGGKLTGREGPEAQVPAADAQGSPDSAVDAEAPPDGGVRPDGAEVGAAVNLPPFCKGAGWSSPRQLALVLFAQGTMTYVRADGTRSVVQRLPPAPADQPESLTGWARGRHVVSKTLATAELTLFDDAGTLLWRRRPSFGNAGGGHWTALTEAGDVVTAFQSNTEAHTEVIRRDGTVLDAPGVMALDLPDQEGWLPVIRPPASTTPSIPQYGFVRPGTGAPAMLSRTFAAGNPWPSRFGTRFVYLGVKDGMVELVDERPTSARAFPLGLANDGQVLLHRTQRGVVVVVSGRPRWRWRPADDQLGVIPALALTDQTVSLHGDDAWLLVSTGELRVPRVLIDLDQLSLHEVPSFPQATLPDHLRGRSLVQHAGGRWFLGSHGSQPAWVLDAVTRQVVVADLARLAPLRPFMESPYCSVPGAPQLLPDGRVAAALRTDTLGGLFVGRLSESAWTRVGQAVADVFFVSAARYGDTWVIDAATQGTCPLDPWKPAEPNQPQPLLGPSAQAVPGVGGAPMVIPLGPQGYTLNMHPSGHCAVIDWRYLYDFAAGERWDLGQLSGLAWP